MSYIHADHLNTPRVISKPTGEIQWRWDSDAFGSIAANEDPSLTGQRFRYNLRFPGQVYDEETGLHYNYFRDYNPSTGRYIQSDPIGLAGGVNTYGYVEGNPVSYVDLTGEAISTPVAVGSGVLVVGSAIYMSSPSGKKAVKSFLQKMHDLCKSDDKDPCEVQREYEEESCSKYRGWMYRACMERAYIREDMCRRKQPDPPPPWSDADINGWAPPSAPRGK